MSIPNSITAAAKRYILSSLSYSDVMDTKKYIIPFCLKKTKVSIYD